MQTPARPSNEAARIAALRSLNVLDSEPDERFDRLTRLAKRVFNAPIALVSLVDGDRQWFKSCAGTALKQTPRDVSFCGHVILDGDLMVIEDTQSDARFLDNPLVTGLPGIRFYAGCPLTLRGGIRVGSFCVLDTKPRTFGEEERALLRDLGRMAEREFEVMQIAMTDDLTGLSNRRGFEALGGYALQLCKRKRSHASVFFFDLNGFKRINDDYGHAEGDRAIVGFGNVLRAALRETDVLARLGGDEFVALAVDAGDSAEAKIVERVRLGVERYNRETRRGYDLRYSVGRARYDAARETSISELIAVADHAMYANKRAKAGSRSLDARFVCEASETISAAAIQ